MNPLFAAEHGPQASTRNVKDRRPSLISPAAQSLASLEQRLSTVEKHTNNLPQSPGLQRSNVAHDLDVALKNVDTHYHDLDKRLSGIEKRVLALDSNHKPFEAYQQQALDAVKQLQELKKRLQSCGPRKNDVDLTKRLNHQTDRCESNLQEVAGRLKQLEDQAELAKAQQLSTRDLAAALTHRLGRGDLLDDATMQALAEVILGKNATLQHPPSLPRQEETPATDSGRLAESVAGRRSTPPKSSNEVPKEVSHAAPLESSAPLSSASLTNATEPATRIDNERPTTGSVSQIDKLSSKKRRRDDESAMLSPQIFVDRDSEPLGTPQAEDALDRFMSGALSEEQTPAAKRVRKAVVGEKEDSTTGTPDSALRRTGRKPRPVINHDMVHWKDAYKQVKTRRPSVQVSGGKKTD